ncbi:MAG: TldD/PmbA family protein [Thermodesulfovibrionia bacterium]|nr:TldD/PmbA family protein [Thermodesulfovibrionia bacterium]
MDVTLLAADAVKDAISKGCDEAEVFIKTAKRFSVEVKNNGVEALNSAKDFGISLRVIKNHRLGFSFTTNPESSGLEDMVREAVEGAKWTAEDKYIDIPSLPPFNSPLTKGGYRGVKGGLVGVASSEALVFDEKIESMKENDVINNALFLEKTALDFDSRIKKVRKAEVALASGSTTIFSSKGIKVSYDSSSITASVTTLADDGHDMQTGWDFAVSRRLSDIDFGSIAEAASKKAIDLLGSRKIISVRIPVILDSSVASDFLGIFSSSLSAEAVQKKRSFLANKIGKNIISPIVNIFDDGLMPWRIGTKPVDDEGVPTSKKMIVSKGALTGFIHNTYTAKKEGTVSTGNAVRGGFKTLPGVGVTNLYIEPKPPSLVIARDEVPKQSYSFGAVPKDGIASPSARNDRLVKSVSKGILVLEAMGVHTANPISGDFSVGISGLWIENGEIKYPIKEAVMSGNVLELFKRIERVGSDLKFYGKIGSPSLLIGEMDISA